MDLIDRSKAVEALEARKDKTAKGEVGGFYNTIIQHDIDTIEQLPPAKPKWIPCSERMPRVREWVLCQCRAGIMDVLRLTEDGDWNKNYPLAVYMSSFVIAWMPLPKPYKGEAVK